MTAALAPRLQASVPAEKLDTPVLRKIATGTLGRGVGAFALWEVVHSVADIVNHDLDDMLTLDVPAQPMGYQYGATTCAPNDTRHATSSRPAGLAANWDQIVGHFDSGVDALATRLYSHRSVRRQTMQPGYNYSDYSEILCVVDNPVLRLDSLADVANDDILKIRNYRHIVGEQHSLSEWRATWGTALMQASMKLTEPALRYPPCLDLQPHDAIRDAVDVIVRFNVGSFGNAGLIGNDVPVASIESYKVIGRKYKGRPRTKKEVERVAQPREKFTCPATLAVEFINACGALLSKSTNVHFSCGYQTYQAEWGSWLADTLNEQLRWAYMLGLSKHVRQLDEYDALMQFWRECTPRRKSWIFEKTHRVAKWLDAESKKPLPKKKLSPVLLDAGPGLSVLPEDERLSAMQEVAKQGSRRFRKAVQIN